MCSIIAISMTRFYVTFVFNHSLVLNRTTHIASLESIISISITRIYVALVLNTKSGLFKTFSNVVLLRLSLFLSHKHNNALCPVWTTKLNMKGRVPKSDSYWFTVYPKKYANGLVVICFVVVMQSFIMNSHEVFIHIHQGCFAGTAAIVR